MTSIEAAERAGFDMSLIDESLRLTPEQRALQHDAALELAQQLEAAGRRLRDAAWELWLRENADAIATYNKFVAEKGTYPDGSRSF